MFFVSCTSCKTRIVGPMAEEEGWFVERGHNGTRNWYCPEHAPERTDDAYPISAPPPAHEETQGFTEPEDGSEDRYRERQQTVPWRSHTLWWVVHNFVAHPLIALIPRRTFFRFHDWTSRKMHGR